MKKSIKCILFETKLHFFALKTSLLAVKVQVLDFQWIDDPTF